MQVTNSRYKIYIRKLPKRQPHKSFCTIFHQIIKVNSSRKLSPTVTSHPQLKLKCRIAIKSLNPNQITSIIKFLTFIVLYALYTFPYDLFAYTMKKKTINIYRIILVVNEWRDSRGLGF